MDLTLLGKILEKGEINGTVTVVTLVIVITYLLRLIRELSMKGTGNGKRKRNDD